jgi:Gas vesicle synthesis protein GvpL/GvpF
VTSGDRRVYVYGIVPAAARLDIQTEGVGGGAGRLRQVREDIVAALVSDVDPGPLAAARDLRAHWAVLEEVAQSTTVLPVRFGTVMESDAAVVDRVLRPDLERLGGMLAELDGKVQLTLKGFYDEERLLREIVHGSPQVARLRQRVQSMPEAASYYDRIRLGELVSAELERRRGQDTEAVLRRLEPLAVAARVDSPTGQNGAVNAAFLVDRSRVDEFSGAVQGLAGHLGERVQLRYVGPLPPYSFADEEAPTGGGSWG